MKTSVNPSNRSPMTLRNGPSLSRQRLNIRSRESRIAIAIAIAIAITTQNLFAFTGLQGAFGFCLRDFFFCEDFGDGAGKGVGNVIGLVGLAMAGLGFALVELGAVKPGFDLINSGVGIFLDLAGVIGVGICVDLIGVMGDGTVVKSVGLEARPAGVLAGLRERQVFLKFSQHADIRAGYGRTLPFWGLPGVRLDFSLLELFT